MPADFTAWGRLAGRYSHPRPRRLLALDGGGIRGLITLGILEELERRLAHETGQGDRFRLCGFFDYIGGTSTGAIIATGLARGMRVSELIGLYQDEGGQMFKKRKWSGLFKSRYGSEALSRMLQRVFGEETNLCPENLNCLLLIVLRNASTDSPWPLSSNPHALYNDPTAVDCNLNARLWQLVRASTAAPTYFPPEPMGFNPRHADTKEQERKFIFVDGGVTPYNNPAFQLYRMATLPEYKLEWPAGESDLLVVSVGSGGADQPTASLAKPEGNRLQQALAVIQTLLRANVVDQDIACRTVGHCTFGARIDSELGRMVNAGGVPKQFLYVRYDADLTLKGLDSIGAGGHFTGDIGELDAVHNIPHLRKIGQAAARQIDLWHFGPIDYPAAYWDHVIPHQQEQPQPLVVALAGRRIDPDNPTAVRFPRHKAPRVRRRIRELFRQQNVTAVVSSAACGADLLGQEAAGRLGLDRRIVLAFDRDRFRELSVTDRPGDWGPRFDRMVDTLAAPSDLITLPGDPDQEESYRTVNDRILDEAANLARAKSLPVAAVTVWNLESRGKDDITEHFRRGAAARGMQVFDISTL